MEPNKQSALDMGASVLNIPFYSTVIVFWTGDAIFPP